MNRYGLKKTHPHPPPSPASGRGGFFSAHNQGQRTNYTTGLRAEKIAEILLILKGYRILARRYKTPVGEIDLVAKRGRTIAFIEVKRRASREEGVEAIHAKNQARVRNAASLYLQNHPQHNTLDARFDAVILNPRSWPRHIPRAWE